MNAQGNIAYIPRGLTARIAGFHPAGPGSTPGVGKNVLINTLLSFIILIETPTPSWAMYFTLYIKPWFPLKVITVVLASDIWYSYCNWIRILICAKKVFAMAGSRTRINCLKGSYADRYTTIAFLNTQI